MELVLLAIVLNVVWAILCALAAPSRGRDGISWFVLGLLFGLFALIALLLMGRPDTRRPGGEAERELSEAEKEREVARLMGYVAEPPSPPVRAQHQRAMEALQLRYATGEISREEYEQVRADLLRDSGS